MALAWAIQSQLTIANWKKSIIRNSLDDRLQLALANRQKSIIRNSLDDQLQLALAICSKSSLIQVL